MTGKMVNNRELVVYGKNSIVYCAIHGKDTSNSELYTIWAAILMEIVIYGGAMRLQAM